MPSGQAIVRHAEERDRDAVLNVLLGAYSQYETTLEPDRWTQYKESIVEAVDAATTKARLVAELDGRLVGSVFIYDSSEAAYGAPQLEIHNPIIRLLGVLPSARGSGIATALIRESVRVIKEWGADTLHLHTSDMMDSAVRLYERLGFERAYDKEFHNGAVLVKSYRLKLSDTALLNV
ncbi:GNAT family N-acetyltransferase [Cohnella cellulosilytica]|uniref:GNAT family N-acetyltransferase n=1 Tax=Cohnella cellulosilytica TaxID=986710 RepID=A0ABW2F9E1_9BACL